MLPQEIGDAAQNGDRDRVIAWLNAGGSIDDVDVDGYTLVHCCACGNRGAADIDDKHIALVRQLIALGADVNIPTRVLGRNEHWLATKRLVAGVRKYGTYKRYMRAPHRDVLAVRGLAQRGKLATRDSVLNFLARLGDNGVCWHILSFWRATN